jgi:hypothetical protein
MRCVYCINCSIAAKKGHLQCMKEMIERPGFSWTREHDKACIEAAAKGHLACLQYAKEKGCHFYSNESFSLLKYEFKVSALHMAIMGGHIECLRYVIRKGHNWHSHTHILLAIRGFLEGMKEMYRPSDDWSWDTIGMCAFNGHLECLKYVIENTGVYGPLGVSEDEDITDLLPDELAAYNGHLNCLEYLYDYYKYDNFIKRGEQAIPRAIKNGHKDCVRFLIEREYPYVIDNSWLLVVSSSLDDPWWRSFLFDNTSLKEAPKIRRLINKKKREIKESLKILHEMNKIPQDIIKYVIPHYL